MVGFTLLATASRQLYHPPPRTFIISMSYRSASHISPVALPEDIINRSFMDRNYKVTTAEIGYTVDRVAGDSMRCNVATS